MARCSSTSTTTTRTATGRTEPVTRLSFACEPLTPELLGEMLPLLDAHWREVGHFQDIPLEVDEEAYLNAQASGALRCFTARSGMTVYGEPCQVLERGPDSAIVLVDGYRCSNVVPAAELRGNGLVGYAVFFVRGNPHYKSSRQAVQDVLFLHKSARGNGARFVAWCDHRLVEEGTEVVYHHVKAAHDFGVMLERQGYELVDKVYAKRLTAPRDRPTVREALDEAFI